MGLFGGGDPKMVSRESALKGRSETMSVSPTHYVLKTLMKAPWPQGMKTLVVANGCFWGSEKGMWRLPGVYSTAVGYSGGFTPNPTYQEVCSGNTGHTESVQVVYDPARISVVDLLRWHWESHDPCQGMGQGNDRGTQYRSAIYFFDDEQRALAVASKAAYETALGKSAKITTEIKPASELGEAVFYYAEDYHQQYLAKPGSRPYCSAEPRCVSLPPFSSWCPAGLEKHAPKLPESFWAANAPTPHCVVRAPNEPFVL